MSASNSHSENPVSSVIMLGDRAFWEIIVVN